MTKVYPTYKKQQYGDFLLQGAEAEKFEMPNPSIYRNQAELYHALPDIGIAIEMLMNVGSLMRIDVVTHDKGEEEKEVTNHDFEELLKAPNPLQSGIEFLQDTIGFRMLNRNCYWWLNKPSRFEPPVELWIIPPDKITPIPDGKQYLKGYRYEPYGSADAVSEYGIFLEPWEVEHFKGFNPFNRFVGLSLMESLLVAALGVKEAREWNTRLFGQNNARMPGILAFKDYVNDTDWTRLQGEVLSAAEKRQNLMLRGVGQGGVEWLQASSTMREMEFLEGMQDTRRLIWDYLAPGLSSMLDPSSTEASSKTGETVFRNYAVYPLMKYIESRLNRRDNVGTNPGLLQTYGDQFYARVEDFRLTDKAMQMQEIDTASKFKTIDEVRKEFYSSPPIGDERGDLLVAEIKSAGGFGEQPSEEEKPNPMENNQNMNKEPEEEVMAGKAEYKADLIKWREKALKRETGVKVDYESDLIPVTVKRDILAALPSCKSKTDIKLLFQKHISASKPKDDGVEAVRLLLETALRAYKIDA